MKDISMTKEEISREIVKGLEPFNTKELREVESDIANYLAEHPKSEYFIILSRVKDHVSYTTFFKKTKESSYIDAARKIMEVLTTKEMKQYYGEMKVGKRSEVDLMEFWLGETVFLLADGTGFLVEMWRKWKNESIFHTKLYQRVDYNLYG